MCHQHRHHRTFLYQIARLVPSPDDWTGLYLAHFCIKQKVFSRMRHTELSLNVRYNILFCPKEFLLLIRLRE